LSRKKVRNPPTRAKSYISFDEQRLVKKESTDFEVNWARSKGRKKREKNDRELGNFRTPEINMRRRGPYPKTLKARERSEGREDPGSHSS